MCIRREMVALVGEYDPGYASPCRVRGCQNLFSRRTLGGTQHRAAGALGAILSVDTCETRSSDREITPFKRQAGVRPF